MVTCLNFRLAKKVKAASFLGERCGEIHVYPIIKEELEKMSDGEVLVLDLAWGKRCLDYGFFSTSIAPLLRELRNYENRYIILKIDRSLQRMNVLMGLAWYAVRKISSNEKELLELIERHECSAVLFPIIDGEEELEYIGISDKISRKVIRTITEKGRITPLELSKEMNIPIEESLLLLQGLHQKRLVYSQRSSDLNEENAVYQSLDYVLGEGNIEEV